MNPQISQIYADSFSPRREDREQAESRVAEEFRGAYGQVDGLIGFLSAYQSSADAYSMAAVDS